MGKNALDMGHAKKVQAYVLVITVMVEETVTIKPVQRRRRGSVILAIILLTRLAVVWDTAMALTELVTTVVVQICCTMVILVSISPVTVSLVVVIVINT